MAFNEFETDTSKLLLQAVGVLLQTIGEEPVVTEDDLVNVREAQLAVSVLIETKKEVLADEWDINYDEGYTLMPSTTNKITIPYNVLEVNSQDGDLVARNWLLYSKSEQSDIFTEAQTVNVVWDVLFNSIPHALRNYITTRAARKFQARNVMDTSVYAFTKDDEEEAFIIAKRSNGRTIKANMYNSGYGQNYLVDGSL